MRAALSALAAVLGVVAALLASVLWTAGSDALDDERFADATIAALRAPEGQVAIAARVEAALADRAAAAGVTPETLAAAVDEAVAGTVEDPGFDAAMTPALETAHRVLLELSGEPVRLDLEPLRTTLTGELSASDPNLVGVTPGPGELGSVEVADPPELPVIPAADLNDRVPLAVGAISLLAAALLACAVALARRPARVARVTGAALVVLGAVPVVAGLLVPGVIEDAVDPPDDGLARRLTEEMLSSWPWSAGGLVVAGLGLLLVPLAAGRATRRARPPLRTPAA